MNTEIIYALKQLEKEKSIPMDILLEAIELALISAYKRNFGHAAENVYVQINRDTGETEVYEKLTVVEKVENPDTEIALKEAKEYDEDIEIDDEIEAEVTPSNFGRIAAQTAKQVILQRIKEAERDILYNEYADKVGTLITGIFQRYENKNILLDVGKIECVVPTVEQIETERLKYSDKVKAYVLEIIKSSRGPQIIASRTNPNLVAKLFELEVPEIHQGIIQIKNAAREAGSRTKIAVFSKDSNVDPVGACVGPKGSRVKNIVEELRGEKLDIISWKENPAEYISHALSPAKALSVIVYEHNNSAYVVVPDDQLSLAIGKEGQNVRLAAKLTGWKIDIKSETQSKEEPPPPQPTPEELKAIREERERQKVAEQLAKEEALAAVQEETTVAAKEITKEELTPEKLAMLELESKTQDVSVIEKTAPSIEEEEKPKYKKKDKYEEDVEVEKEIKKIKKPSKKKARHLEYDQDDEYAEYYRKFEE